MNWIKRLWKYVDDFCGHPDAEAYSIHYVEGVGYVALCDVGQGIFWCILKDGTCGATQAAGASDVLKSSHYCNSEEEAGRRINLHNAINNESTQIWP